MNKKSVSVLKKVKEGGRRMREQLLTINKNSSSSSNRKCCHFHFADGNQRSLGSGFSPMSFPFLLFFLLPSLLEICHLDDTASSLGRKERWCVFFHLKVMVPCPDTHSADSKFLMKQQYFAMLTSSTSPLLVLHCVLFISG